jgi:glycosyltransferase involved in cell wall biosynthesis
MPARLEQQGREKNPYLRLLYTGLAGHGIDVATFGIVRLLRGGWHVWHMHFPELALAERRRSRALRNLALLWLAMKLAGMRGTRLIWTIHNLKPHEARYPKLEGWLYRMLIAHLDAAICLSSSGVTSLREHHRASSRFPAYVIPHGHFRHVYPDEVSRAQVRRHFGVEDGPLLLFLGQLRRYKNLLALVECFRDAAAPDWQLVIAGEPRDPELADELTRAISGCRQIRVVADFIQDGELQRFLRASDLVILPYTEILNSGAAILALSFDRPVLVPAKGAMADLRDSVGKDWVMTYDGSLSTGALRAAVTWARTGVRSGRAPLDGLEWDQIHRQTAEVFRRTAGSAGCSSEHGRAPGSTSWRFGNASGSRLL